MRARHVLAIGSTLAVGAAAAAIAAHPKVDPATVPTGYFTAHSRMNGIPVAAVRRVLEDRRADGFLQHLRLLPGETTRFLTHPGPVFVMVARGSVVNEEVARGRCRGRTYVQDRGFVTRGRSTPHRMTAGSVGAELYLFYLAPRGTGPTQTEVATPSACR